MDAITSQPPPDRTNYIDNLPDEILIQIFQCCLENPCHLPNLSLVNQHFYRITRDPYFFPYFEIIAKTGLKNVCVPSWHYTNKEKVLIRFFEKNADNLKRIESLDLFKIPIRNRQINLVCKYFTHIKELKWNSSSSVDAKAIEKFKVFTNLESLDLSDTTINNQCLKIISLHCPNLRRINLEHCKKLNDSSIETLVKLCPQLESINLSACYRLTNRSLQNIAEHCQNFKEFICFNNKKLSNDGFIKIFSNCRNLKKIWCDQITETALRCLLQYCSSLSSLFLGNNGQTVSISADTLKSLGDECPEIEELHLHWNQAVPQGVISNHFSNLKSLNLRGWQELYEEEIKSIIDRSPGLTTLDLGWNLNVTDDTVQYIAENLDNLTSIHLEHCRNISHLFLYHLADNCPHLKELSFMGYVLGEDNKKALINFLRKNPNLETFYLGGYYHLSDAMLRSMAPSLQKLRKVTLYYCNSITDKGIEFLARYCRRLEVADIRQCRNVTIKSLAILTANCPHLKIIHFSSKSIDLCKYFTYSFSGKIKEECIKYKWENN